MPKRSVLVALLLIALVLAACGGGGEEPAPAAETGGVSAAVGEELFAKSVLGNQAGCITCHSLNPDTVLVGPSMAGVATRAGSTVPGQSAEDYLRAAILQPDAYVVEGFAEGVMPARWGDELGTDQIDSLIAYLQTLQ